MAEAPVSSGRRSVSLQTVIQRRWGDVLWSLRRDPGGLIRTATRSPTGRLYVRLAGFEVSRALRLDVGSISITEREARLPVSWGAEAAPNLFPTMRGQLVAALAAREETQLTLSGEYRPPLGLVGRLLDRVVGFRIAQETLHRFLDDLARYLETEQLDGN